MIRPPFGTCPNVTMARSISAGSRTSIGRNSTPSDGATAWMIAYLTDPRAHSGVPKDRCSLHAGRDLFEQLEPFSAEAVLEWGKSTGVAARTCQALDEPSANRVDDTHEHNRYRSGCLLERSHRGAC